jgi:hypothetical protein
MPLPSMRAAGGAGLPAFAAPQRPEGALKPQLALLEFPQHAGEIRRGSNEGHTRGQIDAG